MNEKEAFEIMTNPHRHHGDAFQQAIGYIEAWDKIQPVIDAIQGLKENRNYPVDFEKLWDALKNFEKIEPESRPRSSGGIKPLECQTCRFWFREMPDASFGKCRRMPPQYVEFGAPSQFPSTDQKEYCFEWVEHEKED